MFLPLILLAGKRHGSSSSEMHQKRNQRSLH